MKYNQRKKEKKKRCIQYPFEQAESFPVAIHMQVVSLFVINASVWWFVSCYMFRFLYPSPSRPPLHHRVNWTKPNQNQIKNKVVPKSTVRTHNRTISGSVSRCEPRLLRGRHSRQRVHTCRSPPSYDQVSSAISEWFSSPRFRTKELSRGKREWYRPNSTYEIVVFARKSRTTVDIIATGSTLGRASGA